MSSAEASNRTQVLGVDFGESRVGLALSDEQQKHCVPLKTVDRRSDAQVIEEVLEIATEHGAGEILVGEPKNVDGSRGPAAKRARSFARKLSRRCELPVTLVDEALTTVEATERLREAGLSGAALRARVDAVAAQVLLEGALSERAQRPGDSS
ncbi:MAG: Holliday junction resolvase RuvX [Acidobacteriota bacterium]